MWGEWKEGIIRSNLHVDTESSISSFSFFLCRALLRKTDLSGELCVDLFFNHHALALEVCPRKPNIYICQICVRKFVSARAGQRTRKEFVISSHVFHASQNSSVDKPQIGYFLLYFSSCWVSVNFALFYFGNIPYPSHWKWHQSGPSILVGNPIVRCQAINVSCPNCRNIWWHSQFQFNSNLVQNKSQ